MGENSQVSAGLSYAKYRLQLDLMIGEDSEGNEDLNPFEFYRHPGTGWNAISALIRDLKMMGLSKELWLYKIEVSSTLAWHPGREKVRQYSK